MVRSVEEILKLRRDNQQMRDREFAHSIGISEAELVAAYCTVGEAIRLKIDFFQFLENAPKLGTIMALTRNNSAVSEVTGSFSRVFPGEIISYTLGEIDLRIIGPNWAFAFTRTIEVRSEKMATIEIFNPQGGAVFKIYQKKDTNMAEWAKFVELLKHNDQTGKIVVAQKTDSEGTIQHLVPDIDRFRERWANMTDVHELHHILKEEKINRHTAIQHIGEDYAYELSVDSIKQMLEGAHSADFPIMCFVGSNGCIQIFTGKVGNTKMHEKWLNLLDEKFHLHLDLTTIDQVWAVKKPTKWGPIHSIEVFNTKGEIVIQFFGQRDENKSERAEWRSLVASLPRRERSANAVA